MRPIHERRKVMTEALGIGEIIVLVEGIEVELESLPPLDRQRLRERIDEVDVLTERLIGRYEPMVQRPTMDIQLLLPRLAACRLRLDEQETR